MNLKKAYFGDYDQEADKEDRMALLSPFESCISPIVSEAT